MPKPARSYSLIPDSIGDAGTRIPVVVVSLLDAAGTSVHPAEDETADEVIPGHF